MLIVETLTPVGGAGLLPQAKPKAATASPNAKDRYRICLFLPERNAAPGGEQEEYQRKLLARIRVVWTETYGGGKRVTLLEVLEVLQDALGASSSTLSTLRTLSTYLEYLDPVDRSERDLRAELDQARCDHRLR